MQSIEAVSRSEAFPVPTTSNPRAVFTKEKTLIVAEDEDVEELVGVRKDIALARNDNRAKVAEYLSRKADMEAYRKRSRDEQAKLAKAQKAHDLLELGIPETSAYMMDTAQFVARNSSSSHRPKSDKKVNTSEKMVRGSNNEQAKLYHRTLNRVLGNDSAQGAERLRQDVTKRADRNAKRMRNSSELKDGISAGNAQFNKALDRTISKDARAQTIKQNLERGTAL